MPSHLKIGFLQQHYYVGINTLHPLLKKFRYQDFKMLSTKTLRNITFAYFFTSHTCPFIKVGRSRKTLPRRYYRLVYVVLIFSDICNDFTFSMQKISLFINSQTRHLFPSSKCTSNCNIFQCPVQSLALPLWYFATFTVKKATIIQIKVKTDRNFLWNRTNVQQLVI